VKEDRKNLFVRETILKAWEAQLDSLKKARANYVKAGKEAQSISESLEKKKQDPKVKPEVVSQLSSKSMAANDKRDKLDDTYKSTLDATNEKMDNYYSQEQPKLLSEYQQFEEDRINFMKNQMNTFVNNLTATHLSNVFESSCEKMSTIVNNISVENDISSWATESTKNIFIPNPITYLSYDIEGGVTPDLTCGRKPDGGSKAPSSSSSAASPAPVASRAPAPIPEDKSSKKSKSHSSSHQSSHHSDKKKAKAGDKFNFDPSKYNISEKDRSDPKKLRSAATKMLSKADEDMAQMKNQLEASQKLRKMYNEPNPQVEEEISNLESAIQQLESIQADLKEALSQETSTTVDDSNAIVVKAIYSYAAQNESELSFNEGDMLKILQKDESGWWFASLNDKEGFVPANYIEE